MTANTNTQLDIQDDANDGSHGEILNAEELTAQVALLNAEVAKHKAAAKKAFKERDDAKSGVKKATGVTDENGQEYKKLFEETQSKHTSLMGKVKNQSIITAAQARLTKAGVRPEAIDAAAKLLDRELIEWDEDNGVDETSLTAAMQKHKRDYGFLYESGVAARKVAVAADGKSKTGDDKTISREEFDALDGLAKYAKIKSGFKVVNE